MKSAPEDLKKQILRAMLYESFRRSNDVMFFCDRNAVILDINDAFTRHYGYTREEAVGKTPKLLRSRHSTDELYRRMWTSLLNPAKGYWRGEMINQAKDGREIPLILTITTVRDERGEIAGYVSNAIDMTEPLALRAQIAQSEALATIGEMAAVVAHEIRNPLGAIVMAAKQLGADKLEAEDRELVLQVLRTESQRLNETLTNFLAFARPRQLTLVRGDLNALLQEVYHSVQSNPEFSRGIRFTLTLDDGLQPFPFDADQIRQVVWNLVANALQAMEGSGELKIATGRRQDFAFLSVADTGPGIPEASLPQIFKPFHTTKRQGTGLGLAIADRIVKAHGGRIEVKSRVGEGSLFEVLLPSIEN